MRAPHRAAAIALLALALTGCGQGSGKGAPTESPSAAAGLGTGATASANPSGAGTSSVGYPSTAGPYAQAALTAWAGGDTNRVDQLRDAGANIFATLSAGNYDKQFALRSCQVAGGSSYCIFYNDAGDELTLRVSNERLGQPHAIMDGSFQPITFPTDMQAYAQECLDAWKAGNFARISLLTTTDARNHLNAINPAFRSTSWTFVDSQGAAGSSYLAWRDPAGDRIVFRFYNPGVDPNEGPQHRIVDVLWNP